MNLAIINQALGHKSITSTAIYTVPTDETAGEAVTGGGEREEVTQRLGTDAVEERGPWPAYTQGPHKFLHQGFLHPWPGLGGPRKSACFYKLFTGSLTLRRQREPFLNYGTRSWRVTPALP